MNATGTTAQWRWIDTPPISFAGATFDEVTEAVRCSDAVGLVTLFDATENLAVVNLLAPVGAVFWSCPHHDDLMSDYSCSRAAGQDVSVEDIRRELKASHIELGARSIGWFAALLPLLTPRKTSRVSLSENPPYREYYRHMSLALRATDLPYLKARLEREAQDFGVMAFFKCSETLSLREFTPECALGDACFHGLGLDHSGLAPDIGGRTGVLKALVKAVRCLEQGEPFDLNCSARVIAGGTFGSPSETLTAASESVHPDFAKERRIHSLRARLIRLLGWPSHFSHVRNLLSSDNFMFDISGLQIQDPYDMVDELTAYISEMEQRYPVLKRTR